MSNIKLSEIDRDTKRNLIRRVGFETQRVSNGWRLIDKQYDAEQCIDTHFRNIDEVVSVLSGYLMKAGIIVII